MSGLKSYNGFCSHFQISKRLENLLIYVFLVRIQSFIPNPRHHPSIKTSHRHLIEEIKKNTKETLILYLMKFLKLH